MMYRVLPVLFLLFFSIRRVNAQAGTIGVGPLLSCDDTTFSCPNVSGCCTIGGCCGEGCCANGYTCINQGTSDEACCPVSDSTKCGTAASASPSSSPSGGHTCTGIEACPAVTEDGVGWSCYLGETCGFSYEDCNPCPYIPGTGSASSTVDDAGSSPSTTSYSGGSPSSASDSGSSPSSASDSGSSPSSASSPETSPSSGSGGSATSWGYRSRESGLGLRWLAAVSLAGGIALVVLCT